MAVTTAEGHVEWETHTSWYRVVGELDPQAALAPVVIAHGGPGSTHDYVAPIADLLEPSGRACVLYDQIGSGRSQHLRHAQADFWTVDLFKRELAALLEALGITGRYHFLGQSWGGMLAMEYALKYQQHLKGLIISNMMSSIPAYNEYATKVIMPAMDQKVLAEVKGLEAKGDYNNPRYMELLIPNHYAEHVIRIPPDQWPDPVNRTFKHINPAIYIPMQGPSELGASGKLVDWDRSKDLAKITVPTLVIGAGHDTMDPKHMEWMSKQMPKGRFLLCPNGGHLSQYDDRQAWFTGVIAFLKDVGNN